MKNEEQDQKLVKSVLNAIGDGIWLTRDHGYILVKRRLFFDLAGDSLR